MPPTASVKNLLPPFSIILWANVTSRAEFRWDHSDEGTPFGSSANSNGEGASVDADSFILALNVIYSF
jgi:hypothetical protein